MSLIHPGLLLGLSFLAIPVILHFMLKSKPKSFVFPALQFIKERRTSNAQRMRLRHFWLLLMRIAIIGLLVFTLARPSLPAANYEFNRWEWGAFLGVIAVAIGVYFAFSYRWKKKAMPKHLLKQRFAWLRTILVLVGFVFVLLFVAYPYQRRIQAEITSPVPIAFDDVPVAAVMLFDTSVSMEYLYEGKSHLERAKEIAAEHLNTLPSSSKVAISETSRVDAIHWQADLGAALRRVRRSDAIKVEPLTYDLNQQIQAAIEIQKQHRADILEESGSVDEGNEKEAKDRYIREVYLFTDLASSAWRMNGAESLRRQIEAVPWLNVYLIDVGLEQPFNLAVADLRLSSQVVTHGRPLYVEALIRAEGHQQGSVVAELYLSGKSGEMIKYSEQELTLKSGEAVPINFRVTRFSNRVTRGEVRLLTNDPIRGDNRRYFTVRVKKPQRVLLVSDRLSDSYAFSQALAPSALVREKRAPYSVRSITVDKLGGVDVYQYDAICLVNVSKLSDVQWEKLTRYVSSGRGLGVILGNTKIDPLGYQAAGETLLPGVPSVHSRSRPAAFIDFRSGGHPLSRSLDGLGAATILSSLNINRYWKLEKEMKGTVIARYSNKEQSPALLHRLIGEGHVVLLTTSVDLVGGAYGKNWSDLVRGGWAYMAFADQMMQTLTGAREQTFNTTIGGDLSLRMKPKGEVNVYWLRMPELEQETVTVPYRGPFLTLTSATDSVFHEGEAGALKIGHYSLSPDVEGSEIETGFSINLESKESDLTRLESIDLDELLGVGRYQTARNIAELQRDVRIGRLGRDVSPILLFVMLIVFCGEHFVANYFYKGE